MVCLARPELCDERAGLGTRSRRARWSRLDGRAIDLLVGELGGERSRAETRRRDRLARRGKSPSSSSSCSPSSTRLGQRRSESVPPSVEALLASRLDRLEAGDRVLLERAAVAGREFARGAVVHLTPPDELTARIDRRLGAWPTTRPAFAPVAGQTTASASTTCSSGTSRTPGSRRSAAPTCTSATAPGSSAERAGRARRLPRRAGAQVPQRAASGRPGARGGSRRGQASASQRPESEPGSAPTRRRRSTCSAARPRCSRPTAPTVRAALRARRGAEALRAISSAVEATLVEASRGSSSARDRALRLRAQIELAHLRLFSDPEGARPSCSSSRRRRSRSSRSLSDERALGRTWRHVGYVRSIEGRLGRLAGGRRAGPRSLPPFRVVGIGLPRRTWRPRSSTAPLRSPKRSSAAKSFSTKRPTVPDGRTCLRSWAGSRRSTVGSTSLGSTSPRPRRPTRRSASVHARANNSGRVLGRIEMLSGDPAAAERVLAGVLRDLRADARRCRPVDGRGRARRRPVRTGSVRRGEGWLELAQKRAASDDVSAQWSWRRTRAKLLARAGALRKAGAIAGEAERIAARTDALSDHGAVLLDLAEVLRLADRPAEAARRVEEALLLFERKGNRVSAEAARAMLSELTVV